MKNGLEILSKDASSQNKQYESSLNLIQHTTRNKFVMLKNKMKLLLFLYLCPLAGFIFSLSYYKWLKISFEQENDEIWISLFMVLIVKNEEIYSIEYFRSFLCESFFKKSDKDCSFLKNFHIVGVLSLLFLGIAILAHIYVIFQLFLILIDKYIKLKPKLCIKLRKLQILTFAMYFIGFFTWFIGSGCLYFDLEGLGLCFYINVGSCIFYFLLMLYFLYLKRKIREINRISDYLFNN